jgi:predicted nucleotidyltransferase
MPSASLRTLARHLDVPERTLRRAAAEELIRGRRTRPRRFETSLWPLLRELRAALRTEPNVRLAVLFGSQATGAGVERSDVDVLVVLGDPSAARVAELAGRLEPRLGRDVQLVRLQDAERTPSLMVDVLEHGRVLVDRDGRWARVRSRAGMWRRRAAAAHVALDQAMPDLDLV